MNIYQEYDIIFEKSNSNINSDNIVEDIELNDISIINFKI